MSDRYFSDDGSLREGRVFATGVKWLVAVLVVGGLVSGAIWGIGVLTADVVGRGEARKQILSADNRIQAQERFETLYASIVRFDDQLNDALEHKGDFYENVAVGIQQQCRNTVAEYDAAARKISQRDFRSFDLPQQIGSLDPETDCEEDRV